jgi:uncharacterized membrane protein YbhN (UPF0104 family)
MAWRKLLPLLGVAAALVGVYAFWRVLHRYDFNDLFRAVREVPPGAVVTALALVAAAFVILAAAEYLGLLYAGHRLRPLRVFMVTVAALGIGHSIGVAALSSGAVRLRMYGRSGVTAVETGKVVLFSAITVALGLTGVLAAALLLRRDAVAELLGLPVALATAVALIATALPVAYVVACAFIRRPLRIRSESFALPSWQLAVGQVLLGPAQPLIVGTVLFACVRPLAEIGYADTVSLYAAADTAAILGHVPGGWGVLEYVFTQFADGPGVLAGVLVFRGLYYLLMLLIGAATLILDEVFGPRHENRAARPLSSRPA